MAAEATFTWTAVATASGGGGENVAAFKVGFADVAFNEYRDMHPTVAAGYQGMRYQPGILHFEAVLGGMFDKSNSNTLPTPGGSGLPPYQPGTLVITLVADGTYTRTKTMTGYLFRLRGNSSGGASGGAQRFEYGFLFSAESPTGTVTTA